VETWWEESEQYLLDFLAYTDVAMETARISVGDVLVDMQRAKRDFERLNVQPCYSEAQSDFVAGMEFIINGFGDFQSDMALSVNLNILYANESIGNGIQRLREMEVQLYDDVEEAYDGLFGDWSLDGLRRLGAVTPACSSTEVTSWQSEVREIAYFLPVDVGEAFGMDIETPQNAFLRIVELDYPACVEDAREALLLALDHTYQSIYYLFDDDTYSAADHLTSHDLEYQKYLDELKRINPSQGSAT
jgi:hypothetical protein